MYAEIVKIVGKDFTDRIRLYFIAPFKALTNLQALRNLKEVFTYYRHSTMGGLTEHELVNQSLFSSQFSVKKRLNILSFHYKFLHQRLSSRQRDAMIEVGVTCWQKNFENGSHRIVLKISQKYEYEGCLSMLYSIDDRDIYIMSFTICDGVDFDIDDQFVILISRLQGARGKHEDIAKATKQMIDIYPASTLMSALEGFGLSIGVNKIIAVAAKNQVSIKEGDFEHAKSQYDEFWKTFEPNALLKSGDYLISIPFALKPLKLIRSKFRKRTLAKRSLKKDVSNTMQANCTQIFSFHNSVPPVVAPGHSEQALPTPVLLRG